MSKLDRWFMKCGYLKRKTFNCGLTNTTQQMYMSFHILNKFFVYQGIKLPTIYSQVSKCNLRSLTFSLLLKCKKSYPSTQFIVSKNTHSATVDPICLANHNTTANDLCTQDLCRLFIRFSRLYLACGMICIIQDRNRSRRQKGFGTVCHISSLWNTGLHVTAALTQCPFCLECNHVRFSGIIYCCKMQLFSYSYH